MVHDFESLALIQSIQEEEAEWRRGSLWQPALRWSAPEYAETNFVPNDKVDLWAFGMVMQEVFTLDIPFTGLGHRCELLLFNRICDLNIKLRPSRPETHWMTDGIWQLMNECWKEPDERPAMKTIEARLRNAALSGCLSENHAPAVASRSLAIEHEWYSPRSSLLYDEY